MVKVTINKEECIGCQACISICSKYFEYNDKDNKAYLKGGKLELEVPDSDKKLLKDAEDICPVDAIKVH